MSKSTRPLTRDVPNEMYTQVLSKGAIIISTYREGNFVLIRLTNGQYCASEVFNIILAHNDDDFDNFYESVIEKYPLKSCTCFPDVFENEDGLNYDERILNKCKGFI